MTTEPISPRGHFDQFEQLLWLIENDKPAKPSTLSLAEHAALSPNARQEYDDMRIAHVASNIVVRTPHLESLLKELRRASLRADRAIGRTGVVLSGPPAAGKTTGAFRAMVDGLARHEKRYPEWRKLGHIPVVYVEVPPGSNARNILGCFLDFLGLPYSNTVTAETRARMVKEHLVRGHTSLVVIDEMQNLFMNSRGHSEAAQAIKALMNAVAAVPLYVGVELESFLTAGDGMGRQFASRSTLISLDRLGIDTPAEQRLWGGVIHAFESELMLLNHEAKSLLSHGAYLWKVTRGSLGTLNRLLTTVALELIDAGDPSNETITMDKLESVKLDITASRDLDRALDIEAGKNWGTSHAA
ncbi:TniB family NTP-binding protein [Microbacterium sp. W1N]|uniref:TniB family NTP-binding protein n=1 Tax=Microbacterium festucae TaxID=2977531 RepID=UPI0021BE3FE3|nr:TniB family NTP-binding protein [Microbacterium festucae]MCT9819296.1 TniB family NTP-binding protein [Microbacterium festucae]